jgi:hypothetical protein
MAKNPAKRLHRATMGRSADKLIDGHDTHVRSIPIGAGEIGFSPRVDPDQSGASPSRYALIVEILDEDVPCHTLLKMRRILRSAILPQ